MSSQPSEDKPSPWGAEGPPPGYYQPPPGSYSPPGSYPPGPYPGTQPGSQPADWGQGPSMLSPKDERTWAVFTHVGSIIAAVIVMAFIAPLLILLIQGSRSPFVRRHAVESLNFQLTLLIALVAGVVLSVATLGLALFLVIPAAIVVAILALIFIIQASIKASRGEDYRYPINIRMVS